MLTHVGKEPLPSLAANVSKKILEVSKSLSKSIRQRGEDISPLIQKSLIHISTHSFNGEHMLCKY